MKFDRPSSLDDLSCAKGGAIKTTYGNLCILMRAELGDQLSFDEMAIAPCLGGQHLRDSQIGEIREMIERRHSVSFGREAIEQALSQVANEKRFHPVRAYLEKLNWDGTPRIDRVLDEVLQVRPTPLFLTYLRCFFIGAVARAASPGCKLDNVLVLYGPQDYLKSTFFDVLSRPWFCDTFFDMKTRQGYLTLASAWIYELGEIDSIVGTRDDSDVKRFISSAEDTFVPPYGRAAIRHPRSTIIVGTTNKKQFLKDFTGNRRYWILHVAGPIRKTIVEEWRDQLWAEAIHEYYEGKTWWLDGEMKVLQREANEEHEHHDPWIDTVARWLPSWYDRPRDPRRFPGDALTTQVILSQALELRPERQDRAAEARLHAIMQRLGYSTSRPWLGQGPERRRVRMWLRDGDVVEEEEQVL